MGKKMKFEMKTVAKTHPRESSPTSSAGKWCSAGESSLSSSSLFLFACRRHLQPGERGTTLTAYFFQELVQSTRSYLSEPVDGVKEQRTEELPLSLWETLHFFHNIHVCQDQWASCDDPKHKHTFIYRPHKTYKGHECGFFSSYNSPKRASISSRSPLCRFSSQSLRRRKNGAKHREDTCLWKEKKHKLLKHSYLQLRTKQVSEGSGRGVTDFCGFLVWVCCSPLFWVSLANRGSRLMAIHPWLSSSSRLYITWAGKGKELKQKGGIMCFIYLY